MLYQSEKSLNQRQQLSFVDQSAVTDKRTTGADAQQTLKQRVYESVTSKICAIDRATLSDVQQVSEYVESIQHSMLQTEKETIPDPTYMKT